MKKIATLLVFALITAVNPVWALDAPIDEGLAKAADHKSYLVKGPGMLVHGVYEIAEAPLEPLNRPYEETVEKKDYTWGFLKGINQGTYDVLEGMTRGLFNIVRSFAPGVGRYEDKDHQTEIFPTLAG